MGKRRSFKQLVRHTVLTIAWQFALCIVLLYLIPLFSVSVEITNLEQQVTVAFLNIFYWISICIALIVIASVNIGKMLNTIKREMNAVYHKSMWLAQNNDYTGELAITEFYDTNVHIEKMQEKIREMLQSEKSQKEDLIFKVSAASHDLKTPLTVIKGNSELLQFSERSEQQKQCLSDIELASNRIELYVNALINYSKTYYDDKSEWHDYSLSEVIETVEQEAFLAVKDKTVLTVANNIMEDKTVHINLNYVVRAVVNIVSNAWEYANPGNKKITMGIGLSGNMLTFTLWNNGAPFSDEVLANYGRLFFRQNKSRKAGDVHYGIGLAFVKRVAEVHQGELNLSNVPDGVQVCFSIKV